jgi:CRP-like cAMP-binding protein
VYCLKTPFIGLAVTLSFARVFLNTVAVALFLANEGPAELPRFFMLLAIITIALSIILGIMIDRMPKLGLARIVLGFIMVVAAIGKLLIGAEVPGAYFIILFSSYVFEIAIEILFWAACAAYLDRVEFKRATALICLGIAFGGALGGMFARALAWTMGTPDLLLIMLPFALIAGTQFAFPASFGELRNRPDEAATADAWPARSVGLLRVAMRYPLLILVALNALMLTVLYGIAEFLFLSVYSEHFQTEQELARFLGVVFALLQTCEFVLLASLSRVLLERTGPLLRNLVFPMTSLACFLYLAFSNKLSAALITHLNADAASNAIFLPIHTANFLALPLGVQGRARTLSEGIFYPAGLAIAGVLLWSMDITEGTTGVEFVAVLFTFVFILINVGVGVLFLPTLVASVRSGVVPLADLAGRIVALPPAARDRVREFLRSALPELRLDGIALSRWLGPTHVADDLVALASQPDVPTRRALVRLAAEADAQWVRRFVDAACGRDDRSSMVALQVMLARRQLLSAERVAPLLRSTNPSVMALARLLIEGSDPTTARASLAPMLRDPQVGADLIEAVVSAGRTDLTGIIVAALPTAPAEQQRQGLAFLQLHRIQMTPSQWRLVGRFVRHREPRVRAEAVALLGGCQHRAALSALSRSLGDRSPLVRTRAAGALAIQGDHAIDPLRRRLVPITLGSTEAAGALSRMDTVRARGTLSESLRHLRYDVRENARLLGHLAAAPEPGPWLGLATCSRDHDARIIEFGLAVLCRSLPRHVFGYVRDALHSEDRCLRANAFEVLASLTRSGLVAEAIEVLRVVLFEASPNARHAAKRTERFDPRATLALARASADPWVRAAARIFERRVLGAGFEPAPVPSRRNAATPGSHDMMLDEQDLERVLILKQIPLFRYLPLDTLLAVSRSVESRRYLPGDVIVNGRGRLEHCHILEAGVISIDRGGTSEPLAAPACLNELVLIGEAMPIGRIVALEPCRVLLLHAVVFHDLSRDHPEILLELCRILARRIRATEGAHQERQPIPADYSREQMEDLRQGRDATAEIVPEAEKSNRKKKGIAQLLRPLISKIYLDK